MTSPRASKKQQELLQFIDGFIKGSGYGPSYREIMRALGYKSVSTVAVHVDQLIAKGYLEKKDSSARSLSVRSLRPVDQHSPKQSFSTVEKKLASLEEAGDEENAAVLRQALEILRGNSRDS